MELYFLNEAFGAVSLPVETAVSVVWSLRYHECGTFTAVFPMDMHGSGGTAPELLRLAGQAAYLWGDGCCGRIETVLCRNGRIQLEGRLLECLLYDRVASTETVYTGTAAEAVLAAVRQWAGDLALALPETAEAEETGSAQFNMEAGEKLGKWIHTVLARYGMSYQVTLQDGQPVLTLVRGVDRSLDSDPGVSRAIFSEEFGNIAGLEEEVYREDVCTRMYVEGGDGTVVTAELPGGTGTIREGYRKAADIRPEAYETEEAYLAALRERGKTLLASAGVRFRLSCIAEYDAEPRFGRDYGLGDICEIYSPAMAIRTSARLTALDVVHEGGMVRLYPSFGDTVIRLKTALA